MRARDEEIWHQAKKEYEVVGQILDALKPLTQNERRRLLNYMWDRYVTNQTDAERERSDERRKQIRLRNLS